MGLEVGALVGTTVGVPVGSGGACGHIRRAKLGEELFVSNSIGATLGALLSLSGKLGDEFGDALLWLSGKLGDEFGDALALGD